MIIQMIESVRDRVSRLEDYVGVLKEGMSSLIELGAQHDSRFEEIQVSFNTFMTEIKERLKLLRGKFSSYSSTISTNLDALKGELGKDNNDVSLVKRELSPKLLPKITLHRPMV